jgi:hypothetical protein
MDKDVIIKKLKKQRRESQAALADQYENTRKCQEFYSGDTMSYRDRIQFQDAFGQKKRAMVQFNSVQAPVDSVVGFMAQNRRVAKFAARVPDSEEGNIRSKYMNALYGYVRDNTNADQLESDQDADMMVNGYGAIDTDISYVAGRSTTDPHGEVVKLKIDPLCVGWDAKARNKNITDARFAYYWVDYELHDAVNLLQNSKEEDFEAASALDSDNDSGYTYNPYGGVYDKIKEIGGCEWVDEKSEIVRVYNHQWFEYETFYRVLNPIYEAQSVEDAQYFQMVLEGLLQDQEFIGPEELEAEDSFVLDVTQEILTLNEKQKRKFVKEFGDISEPIAFVRKCYYTAVYSGDHIFTVFKSISQQGFSIKFKTGIYDAAKKIWIGMVNALMQPAEYYDKALTEFIFTIAANSKGGVLVESDAVEDIAEFEKNWAKTDAVIEVLPGTLGAGKVQEKARPAVPTGLDNVIQLSLQAIENNGVDPAFVGKSDVEQSGILYKRKIRQVISKLARYFDSITLYQKEDARLCDDLIRIWVENNQGVFVRITGDEFKNEFLEINSDSLASEYDVTIQEAAQNEEDRQEIAMILGSLGDRMMTAGKPEAMAAAYAESLYYMNLDGDVRNRLVSAINPSMGQEKVPASVVQELQQQIQMLQEQLNSVQVQKAQAETQLIAAKAQTEAAKVGKTEADTIRALSDAEKLRLEGSLITDRYLDKVHVNV